MKARILAPALALGLLAAALDPGFFHLRHFAAQPSEALQAWREPAPSRLPPLPVETPAGVPLRLSAFQGRPLVLNLWASWCPPCRQEMPVLEAAQEGHPEMNFVFLNQGETRETIARYLEEEGLGLAHVLRDPASTASERLQAGALPTTLFFDAGGRLVGAYTGELTSPHLDYHLRRLAPHASARH